MAGNKGHDRRARREGEATPEQEAALRGILAHPKRAGGIELVGEVRETGFAASQWLVRCDGRFLQLTEPLYRVLELSDGTRSLEDIASDVTETTSWALSPEVVRHIILTKLLPLGLLTGAERPARASQTAGALSVNLRMRMLQPGQIEPVTGVLQWLYRPFLLLPLLLLIAASQIWLYAVHGIGRAIHQVFFTPGLLLVVLAVVLLSILFHEFGHASALRYGGGRVRGMGVGFYLIYPAFYTDTTDSYRLGRWGRVRTDLGGFYFHLVFALALIVLAAVTGHEFLYFVVILIDAEIVRQLLPFARFDGYWALVDLTGMPDFFSQVKPFLRRFLPGRSRAGSLPPLKRWVQAVFAGYILITFPALILLLLLTISRLPTMLGLLSGSLTGAVTAAIQAAEHGHPVLLVGAVVQLLLLTLEIVGLAHLLAMSVLRPLLGVWNRINPLPPTRRAATITTAAALVSAIVLAHPQMLDAPAQLAVGLPFPPSHHRTASVHTPPLATPREIHSGSGASRGAGVDVAESTRTISFTTSSSPSVMGLLLPPRSAGTARARTQSGAAHTRSAASCLHPRRATHGARRTPGH